MLLCGCLGGYLGGEIEMSVKILKGPVAILEKEDTDFVVHVLELVSGLSQVDKERLEAIVAQVKELRRDA